MTEIFKGAVSTIEGLPHLYRKYLKLLPDFDDIEAEERALDFAEQYPYLSTAISFLLKWPAPAQAAKIIEARADELDGNSYYTMTEAADALEAEYPLAATLMRRSMIDDTLNGAKHKRYRYAAQHLAECATSDALIMDYGNFPSHKPAFVSASYAALHDPRRPPHELETHSLPDRVRP